MVSKSKKSVVNKIEKIGSLEDWLWSAACSIRGPVDAPKFKDYILPLIFLRRLSDVFDDEVERLTKEFGSEENALKIIKTDHSLVRFFIPDDSRWDKIKTLSINVGQELTTKIREITKVNQSLQGVIDIVDYNATISGQRIIEDGRLKSLIAILSDPRFRLGLKDVEPDFLGRAYEYLLRKFAEGQGQSAGEFFTPKEVGWLIAKILQPKEGQSVYDPTCGSGGLLIKCQLENLESIKKEKKEKEKIPLQLFGQETNHVTYAIAKMNMIIHDMSGEIKIGDTLRTPKFLDNSTIKKFDIVTANPMWNQKEYNSEFYENDPYERFSFGIPPNNTADWGWIQHMFSSINDKGKIAVVIDAGATARGSGKQGSDKEKRIRKKFVDFDYIETIIRLPENLFYNTPSPGNIIILNKNKKKKNEILLINASKKFVNDKPKNRLTNEGSDDIFNAYKNWTEESGFSKILTKEEIIMNDYNLSPSKYVVLESIEEFVSIEECEIELTQLIEEQKKIDSELDEYLKKLGFRGFLNGEKD